MSREQPVEDIDAATDLSEDLFDEKGSWKLKPSNWNINPEKLVDRKEFCLPLPNFDINARFFIRRGGQLPQLDRPAVRSRLLPIGEDRSLLTCMQRWYEQEAPLLARWQAMLADLHATEVPDFAMFAVANRELMDLAQSSARNAG